MASMTGTRRIVIATFVLAAVSAVFGLIMLTSRPMSSAMPGMEMSATSPAPATADHGEMAGMDMSGSAPTPTPTMDPDMAGMDMSGSAPKPTPTPTMDPDMPGMDMPEAEHGAGETAVAAEDRPIGPVLGTFGGGSAAVLLTAGIMRRRDRAANLAKQAARASRRAQK
ncbi:MAG: hypothetical protein H7270_10185 [Dermatophilaceae bacterium]|nr:hypothetical protein [Dermatophilaceae bacterium]